ncbi:DUF4190 domain-containing protein [Yonghaparkia sp. Root332]|uniref:DUF4190 domain-containing protein n=1 Tax=Yonghaparkia sp. Root332 TaxID=1736516 RepID=UPI0007002FE9|nr:DUF4190 domain-containing protein [Yonghaparkia sp. Root332]KQV26436.1 hypothetical protein ASC54_06025 [Yonghaparkia sp. Root332]
MTDLPPDHGPAQQTPAAAPPLGAPVASTAPPTNVLAILALVAAFIAPPAGLVLGIIAQRQIAQSGESGSGLALAGTIVGGVFTAFIALFLIAWLGTFVSIFATFFTVFAATGA